MNHFNTKHCHCAPTDHRYFFSLCLSVSPWQNTQHSTAPRGQSVTIMSSCYTQQFTFRDPSALHYKAIYRSHRTHTHPAEDQPAHSGSTALKWGCEDIQHNLSKTWTHSLVAHIVWCLFTSLSQLTLLLQSRFSTWSWWSCSKKLLTKMNKIIFT